MNAGCAGKTVRSLENACMQYLSALEMCSRRGAIQIHVYLILSLSYCANCKRGTGTAAVTVTVTFVEDMSVNIVFQFQSSTFGHN